ncbi:tail-anchored protein insertion receptor WRB-like [Scleropages formosus]|uniref:Guided entry of tail-anchored proteins factor 1 n=1 Tax=Scleropages formosus TaxID=113540 RepID=A0A0P7VTN2_SCLFO|nr:tail-anchored protein insertion receptor WRB-like [Scleropages formosus]
MAEGCAWFLVLGSVLLCNLAKTLIPTVSSFLSKVFQKDAEAEMEMRTDIQEMKMELSTVSMMDEFARYARLERKINKTTDKLKSHVKSRTAYQAKVKWGVNIVYHVLQAVLMVTLIWKFYASPVTVLPSKWIVPLERLVAFPSGVAGSDEGPLAEGISSVRREKTCRSPLFKRNATANPHGIVCSGFGAFVCCFWENEKNGGN